MKFKAIKIADLISEISMGPFGSNIKKECFIDDGIPVLNGSNLDGIALREESFRYVTLEKADSLGKANAYQGDVIVTHRGTLGQIVFIPQNSLYDRYVISQSQFRLRCNEKILPEYLVYYFHTRVGQYKLLSNASQVGVPALARATTTFKTIEIEVPPLEGQRKIVKILEDIREKIELNNEINKNLDEQAQAVYHNIFDDCSIDTINISEIIDVRDGTHDSPKNIDSLFYLVTSKHLLPYGVDRKSSNTISEFDFHKINERSAVNTYDILISMIGTVGLISLVIEPVIDFAIKNVGLFRTSQNPKYVYYILSYLRSNKTKQHIDTMLAGSTQKYISLGELRKLSIPMPDEVLLDKYNNIVTPMFEQIINNTFENNNLAKLRDTLIPRLMSGEIDVSSVEI